MINRKRISGCSKAGHCLSGNSCIQILWLTAVYTMHIYVQSSMQWFDLVQCSVREQSSFLLGTYRELPVVKVGKRQRFQRLFQQQVSLKTKKIMLRFGCLFTRKCKVLNLISCELQICYPQWKQWHPRKQLVAGNTQQVEQWGFTAGILALCKLLIVPLNIIATR